MRVVEREFNERDGLALGNMSGEREWDMVKYA